MTIDTKKVRQHRIFLPGKANLADPDVPLPTGRILDELSKQFPQYIQCVIDTQTLYDRSKWERGEFNDIDGWWITFQFTVSDEVVKTVNIEGSVRPHDKAKPMQTQQIKEQA